MLLKLQTNLDLNINKDVYVVPNFGCKCVYRALGRALLLPPTIAFIHESMSTIGVAAFHNFQVIPSFIIILLLVSASSYNILYVIEQDIYTNITIVAFVCATFILKLLSF